MKKKITIISITAVALSVIIAAALIIPGQRTVATFDQDTQNARREIRVETIKPETGDIIITGEYMGIVEANQQITVFPRAAGEVLAVHFNVGDTVQEGDVLFEVDATTLHMTIAQTEKALESAQAKVNQNLKIAQDNLATQRSNIAKGHDATLNNATNAIHNAEAAVAGAQFALENAQKNVANAQYAKVSALSVVDSAEKNVDNAQISVGSADKSVDSAVNAVGMAEKSVSTALAAVDNAQSAAESALKGVETAKIAQKSANINLDLTETAEKNAKDALEKARASGVYGTVGGTLTINAAQNRLDVALASFQTAQRHLDDFLRDGTLPASMITMQGVVTAENEALFKNQLQDAVNQAQLAVDAAQIALMQAHGGVQQQVAGEVIQNLTTVERAEAGVDQSKSNVDLVKNAANQAKHAVEQAQIGAERAEIGIGQAQIGVEQAEISVSQAQIGVEQAEIGVARAQIGVDQAQIAVDQAVYGAERAQIGVEQAEIGVEQAQFSLEQAQRNLQKAVDGYETANVLLNTQLNAMSNQVELAYLNTNLEDQYIALERLHNDLKNFTITAPISGVIERRSIEPNQMAAPQAAAFVISDKSSMTVSFRVPQASYVHMNLNDPVVIEHKGLDYAGHISEIGTMVDTSGMLTIKVNINNPPENMFAGASVKVKMTTQRAENIVMVPIHAIHYSHGVPHVFVARDNHAVRVMVETGIFNDAHIEILSGAAITDNVISTWSANLVDGAEIVEASN